MKAGDNMKAGRMAREHHKSEQGYRGNPRLSETVGRPSQMRTSGAFASDVVDFPPYHAEQACWRDAHRIRCDLVA
jgi:hypothetical protein